MTKLQHLIKEAKTWAKWKGHDMDRFTHFDKTVAVAHCKICERGVVVRTDPKPTATFIRGSAVQLKCVR